MGVESLWAPQTASPWDVCKKDSENYRFDTAENHGECALCKGAKATELVPCCWCTNWVHLRCSYAVPSGRACASHFDVQNPLEKQVVACKDDSLVPEEFRERPVFPNIVIPRYQPNRQAGPKAAMNNMELMWIYRHAWRGAGLYYRKGDHVVTQESQGDKPSSMFKAMTMYPVWDKWIMPRCDAIPDRYLEDPERWNLSRIDDLRSPSEVPPVGRVRWEYLLLDQLSHEQGNLFRLWYEELEQHEKMFWHAFMHKASLKQEYRWEDHCKEPLLVPYDPVKDFDPRFFYYDHYQIITQDLLQPTSRRAEEAKCEDWAIQEEELEPGLALDPNSYAAKVKKRKEPPTESDVLSSVRKRPVTPPKESTSVEPPTSAVTPQSQATEVSSLDTARPTIERASGAVPGTFSQETSLRQSQPTEVSQTTMPSQEVQQITAVTETRAATTAQAQASQGTESQSSQQQSGQGDAQVSAMQSPTGQASTQGMDHPHDPSQQGNSGGDDPRQRRIDKLTRIMLESIHSHDIGIAPASEMIYKAVLSFAEYASQFDHLANAQDKLPDYAATCMSAYYNHFEQRAFKGLEDDTDIVDAVCTAQDAMPTLLPAAFAACIEAEQQEAMARSIEEERVRKEQKELEHRIAELEECEQIQRELEEEERLRSRNVNAEQITQLMINRMVELGLQSQAGEPGKELVGSLTHSLRSFFEQTTSEDAEYLTRSAIEHVSNMKDAESQRIRRGTPDTKAAMKLVRHAGKFIIQLPTAIEQVLKVVQFTALATSTDQMHDTPAVDEHQAEYEENESPEEDPQGLPASGTPPGTPPPWNPRETSFTSRTGRVQDAVQRIEGPPIINVPAPKWHGWKTQTGPTLADVEQSRMSPFGEPDVETPDADLREAMARSLQETRHDPYELPNTGGASGSGAVSQQVISPQQGGTPNTQSEGEGSVIPKGQSRIVATPLQLPQGQDASPDVSLILEERIRKHKERINELVQKMSSFDQDATEADIIELNELKQFVASCQRSLDQAKQGVQVQAIPRPPVQLPRFSSPLPVEDEPMDNRSSRSRPRPNVRGRSKSDKRRHPDSGDRRSSRRRKGDPVMVMPQVIIPPPSVASIFQGVDEELTSSVPTSQEPVLSVPSLFQTAGANLPLGGSPQPNPPPTTMARQSGPPRDPRSQSERRRVSIQAPPTSDEIPLGQIPVPFVGRQLSSRSISAEPKAPSADSPILQSRQDPHQQGRSTYYGRR